MCPKHVEEHNYRNKILYIKLESEVNYHQDAGQQHIKYYVKQESLSRWLRE